MTDRTAPADPREALVRIEELAHDSEEASRTNPDVETRVRLHVQARAYEEAARILKDTLAARQDEPSPALRDDRYIDRTRVFGASVEEIRVALTIADTHDPDWRDILVRPPAGLGPVANPPQTREAEGAAPGPDDDDAEMYRKGWEAARASALRDVGDQLLAPRRTPEAQRDAPPWIALAKIIREVDGNHDLGAGELAERIILHPDFWVGQRDAGNRGPEPAALARVFEAMGVSVNVSPGPHYRDMEHVIATALELLAATQPPAAGTEGGD